MKILYVALVESFFLFQLNTGHWYKLRCTYTKRPKTKRPRDKTSQGTKRPKGQDVPGTKRPKGQKLLKQFIMHPLRGL